MADSMGGADSQHPVNPIEEGKVVPAMQSRTLESSRRNTA